jgi:hypothetical protein
MHIKRSGWNWWAFLFGPFWYMSNGMFVKGFWLTMLTILSLFLAIPFVWAYCGARGSRDRYVFQLKKISQVDLKYV